MGKAINIGGSNIAVRRVRVINWGTHVTDATGECFPIFIAGSGSSGLNVVEDCIIEHPDTSQARESTMLNCHTEMTSLGVFSTMRNNYLNGDFVAGSKELPVDIASITYVDPNMTVNTKWPHRLAANDEVVIQGTTASAFNQRFTVASTPSDRQFTVSVSGLTGSPTGGYVRRYSPWPLRLQSITYVTSPSPLVTIQTLEAHFRKVGEYIRVGWVKTNGSDENDFNGSFAISAVTETTIQYRPNPAPPAAPAPDASSAWLDRWKSQQVIITNASWQPSGTNDGLATVTTAAPHFKKPASMFRFSGYMTRAVARCTTAT